MRWRTSTRRSCAKGASESSIDWFWQTMQRSSCDKWRARASCAGSFNISSGVTANAMPGAASAISKAMAAMRRIALLRRLQRGFGRWLGRADAQPPVGQRQRAAQHHHHRAEPYQQNERLEIKPHGDRTVLLDVAEREIKLAKSARHQRRRGRRHAARGKGALGRLHGADDDAA